MLKVVSILSEIIPENCYSKPPFKIIRERSDWHFTNVKNGPWFHELMDSRLLKVLTWGSIVCA